MAELTTIQGLIDRINGEVTKLRKKLSKDSVTSGKKNFGLVNNLASTKLSDCVTALENVTVYDSSDNFSLGAGATKTLNGYFNNVTATGSDIAGQVTTMDKTITASSRGPVTYSPGDDGKDYYTSVSVTIDSNWADATDTDATQANVLSGKTFIGVDKTAKLGSMPDHSAEADVTLTTATPTHNIASGYYDGLKDVSVSSYQPGNVTPTESAQTIEDTTNHKFITKVVVEAIPSKYKDASNVDGVAANVLAGKKVIGKEDTTTKLITGSMPNNGAIVKTITGLTAATSSITIPAGYHNGAGTVSLTSDICDALAAI